MAASTLKPALERAMDVLLISDQPLTVIALRSVLQHLEAGIEVDDATHLNEAVDMLDRPHHYRLVVLDLDTLGLRSPAAAAALRRGRDALAFALLAGTPRRSDAAIAAAADDAPVLGKQWPNEALIEALRPLLEPARLMLAA
jgi:DNA-binding NarL/FixJ family response regulator